ncbi:aspartate carbamoyltransferase 1, chloroplastic-like [Olea europaea subsp. europaea]|uniref:Aspartate carbamoyltransferase 1, chloroplastic-like n=1 Tax=Olea europaea subsp. europaea TaxID=158383 RepID=A0A8S0R169_OLEEU|nr:aspartate carbamoyltransferase 1, chloroplastic-like [Olea europaea subsp. europaea]
MKKGIHPQMQWISYVTQSGRLIPVMMTKIHQVGVDWTRGRLSLESRAQCRALEVGITSSYSVGNKFQLEDVIEAQQFDKDTLGAIFEVALEMEKIEKNSTGSQMLKGYLMATLFYKPSTRTRLAFESAMKRFGGEVLDLLMLEEEWKGFSRDETF